MKDVYKQEGLAAFTRGLTATMVRAFPTNAATLLTYTLCMRLFVSMDLAPVPGGHATRTPHERLE